MRVLQKAGKLIEGYFAITREKISFQLLRHARTTGRSTFRQTMSQWCKVTMILLVSRARSRRRSSACLLSPTRRLRGASVTVTIRDKVTRQAREQRLVKDGSVELVKLPAGHYSAVAQFHKEDGTEEKEPFSLDLDRDLRIYSYTGGEAP